MKNEQLSAEEIARHWELCSESCLAAARSLSSTDEQMALPRTRLTSLALEYRLKAFICAARSGTPRSSDLSHLANLASRCGLPLTLEQRAGIASLNRVHIGETETSGIPDIQWIAQLCDSISARSSQQRNKGALLGRRGGII